MTLEEAKDFLIDISYKLGNMSVEYLTDKDGEKMREAIKVLEQYSCNNAINHEDTLKAMIGQLAAEATLYKVVKNMPSITFQSKTGHWIYDEEYSDWYYINYKCSCCKRVITIPYETRNEVYKEYPYCHCGAKMVNP